MDLRTRRQQAAALFSFLLLFSPWSSAREEPPDRYQDLGGRVEAQLGGKTYVFPILKTDIEADIQGDLASVKVVQTFANPLSTPVHASYLFPLNHDAAVHAMTMEVGDEKVQAQIKRVEEARQTFEHAKSEGKSAALLTQHRPNMFTQDVANLMPGSPIKVTLRYVQTVPKVDGQYELQVPLVVGPRYQPKGAGVPPGESSAVDAERENIAAEDDTPPEEPGEPLHPEQVARTAHGKKPAHSKTPFGRWEVEALPDYPPVNGLDIPDQVDTERVGIVVHVNGGMPIAELTSPTHPLTTDRLTPERSDVRLRLRAKIT